MPKVTSVTFSGESGTSYEFDTYTKDTQFYDVSAIYIFVKRDYKNGQYYQEALYVGETGELRTRIANHEKWPCVNRHGCTHISVMRVPNKKERFRIETDLIHGLDPVCNRQ